MKTIAITWAGPYTFDTVINHYYRDDDERCDFGLYQIYGPHELYSNKKRPQTDKVLLYIGMTTSGSAFSGRIANHGFCHGPEYEIYLGRLEDAKYDKDVKSWEHDVKDAEKLLINKYAPPYNANGTGDLVKSQLYCPESRVVNLGEKMDFDNEFTSKDVVYEEIR